MHNRRGNRGEEMEKIKCNIGGIVVIQDPLTASNENVIIQLYPLKSVRV